jgi:hypothetical protein
MSTSSSQLPDELWPEVLNSPVFQCLNKKRAFGFAVIFPAGVYNLFVRLATWFAIAEIGIFGGTGHSAPTWALSTLALILCSYFALRSWTNPFYRNVRWICAAGAILAFSGLGLFFILHQLEPGRWIALASLVPLSLVLPIYPQFIPIEVRRLPRAAGDTEL